MLTPRQPHRSPAWHFVVSATLLALFFPSAPTASDSTSSDDTPPSGAPVNPPGPAPASFPAYQPMFPDAAPSRVGSATRGGGGERDMIVLAPNRMGASATDQPALYWYLPGGAEYPLEVVIQERNADGPLLELELGPVPGRRIGAIAVVDHGIRLRPGVEYEWSVALVTDPARRSHDVFSMGTVQYVPAGADLAASLQLGSPAERVKRLLDAGYWYDALQLLQSGVESGDASMAEWQRGLLSGEGLLASSAKADTGT